MSFNWYLTFWVIFQAQINLTWPGSILLSVSHSVQIRMMLKYCSFSNSSIAHHQLMFFIWLKRLSFILSPCNKNHLCSIVTDICGVFFFFSLQTCCGCSSTPCTMRTLLKRRPSTSGNPAKTPQSRQAKVWPWSQSPPSSLGSARLRRNLIRTKILNWKLPPELCRQPQRVMDNIARGRLESVLSEDKSLLSFVFLWGMDSENNHFFLPSLSCFLIISPHACCSKCPHQSKLENGFSRIAH